MNAEKEKLICIATYSDLFEAQVVIEKLSAHGVEAAIQNNNDIACLQSAYAPVGQFNILVLSQLANVAKEIICNC